MLNNSAVASIESDAVLCLASAPRPIWLCAGTLIDGLSSVPLPNGHIVFDTEAIRYVGKADQPPPSDLLKPGQVTPDLEFREFTILPGLIEAHAHSFLEGGELDFAKRKQYLETPAEQVLLLSEWRLRRLIEFGVMAVRDAGDRIGVGLALMKRYRARTDGHESEGRCEPGPRETLLSRQEHARIGVEREINSAISAVQREVHARVLPHLDSPGAAIHRRGRYGSFMARPVEEERCLEGCVADRIAAGAYRLKLIVSGIINFKEGCVTAAPQLSADEVSELVRSARARGRQTFAHASGVEGIENAIQGGVDSIEHGFFMKREQLAKMRDRNIAWVPTIVPVQAQIDHAERMGWDEKVIGQLRRILDEHDRHLCLAFDMGVQILAGSDAGSYGVPHGVGLLYEMELMEQAGLSALAVINSATGLSARRLGFDEAFGCLEPGAKARMILTRHDPLRTVANLRREKICLFDGTAVAVPEASFLTGL